MAELAHFAFILIAIVAFSIMSAYRTTTIEDNGNEMQIEISSVFQNQCTYVKVNFCDYYFTFLPNKQGLQKCCEFLNTVKKECQCGLIQQAHFEAKQKAINKSEEKLLPDAAQSLPKDCKLSLKDCRIAGPKD
ncbi:putative bifunctional inhibitor/plant lipid transfer protein/seed storage helical [Helianthus annuus]|nr:putative bifunctional inhibitor/plant lipid transfer protein/seed storage helical [Helianthus annuus]